MEKIKKIESDAKQSMEIRDKAHLLGRTETEKKLKIALYEKRFIEYNDTLVKTGEML